MPLSTLVRSDAETCLVSAVDLGKPDLGRVLDCTERLPQALLRRQPRHPCSPSRNFNYRAQKEKISSR